MTADEKLAEVEALAIRAREQGSVLSPLMVLAVCEGRVNGGGWHRPLPHDLDLPDGG